MENASTAAADVVQQIKHMLVDDLQLRVSLGEIPDDASLLEDGLALDSISIAELIAQIEDRFGVQFDDQVLDTKLFTNLSILAAFVSRSLAAKSGDAEREVLSGEPSCRI